MRIARHIIKHEIAGEKKYNIDTTGADELSSLDKKGIDISHATIYMPASYDSMEDIFGRLVKGEQHHFIDIGCGKGRAMVVAAHFGFNKITGIDFSKELCKAATENMEKVKKKFPSINYQVINNDAFYYAIPKDADTIFLFNPFDDTIMAAVVNNIRETIKKTPRKITVIYLNPVHKHLFITAGFNEIYHTKKINYLEASILTADKAMLK